MIISKGIHGLAKEMLQRRAEGRDPLILFLGKGCADAARVPTTIEVARQVFREDPWLRRQYTQDRDRRRNEEVLEAFYVYLDDLSDQQLQRSLKRHYAKTPVPLFYQDSIRLIEAGYFLHILTTNIDTLLEQALNGAGLWPGTDYELVSLTSRERRPEADPDARGPELMLVKLHGDVDAQEAALTPDAITETLLRHSRFLRRELSGDMVMVGYEFESEPITRWLADAYDKLWLGAPRLWWVSKDRPEPDQIGPLKESREIGFIHGENARPESFFGRLLYVLEDLERSEREEMEEGKSLLAPGAKGILVVAETEDVVVRESKAPIIPEVEHSDAEYLREQIRRSQQVLFSLEQQTIPGERDEQLEAQRQYQRREIVRLEDQLRGLEENQKRLRHLMQKAITSARLGKVNPDTVQFLRNQYDFVAQEYDRKQPNQDIVSAAVSATVALTERLGPRVIDPDVVRELASLAPSSLMRRQL